MRSINRSLSFVAAPLLLTGGMLAGVDAATASTGTFCSEVDPGTSSVITWTGQGDGASWDDADNWDSNTVPDASQIDYIYQPDYVCIGKSHGGTKPDVTIAKGDRYHVAGIDIGDGASLTIGAGAGLFLGAQGDPPRSYVRSDSGLTLDAAVLGGNSPVEVSGTMHWTGDRISGKKLYATQTSSECVFDPDPDHCPGDTTPGGGLTTITPDGLLLIDGSSFGGAVLGDQREVDNSGTVEFTKSGFVDMNSGTTWVNEAGSSTSFSGDGGIYEGSREGYPAAGTLEQDGAVSRDGNGTAVVGVPTAFGSGIKPKVRHGGIGFNGHAVPKGKLRRGTTYGFGSCEQVKANLCHDAVATTDDPQAALLGTSTAGPKKSNVKLSLHKAPKKLKGHKVIGKEVRVTAPTEKTTHSTHLTFAFDSTLRHITKHPTVFRDGKAITLCKDAGLTAKNTSCAISEKIGKKADTKGDLTVIVISIQPDATWTVAK
ncbi:MAG: hypothetical protein JO246_02740 [Frankiaceae bacterium]|nr:hypothetical protein [Frankiaceae bacterium]MBV9870920.1 hypothetical protein [Frankiaceae bacterium]